MSKHEEKKAWLWRYQEAKKDLVTIDLQYQELVAEQESTGAIEYHAMPGGSGGGNKDLSGYMVKREAVINKYLKARYKKIQIGIEVRNAINALGTAEERQMMTMRYMMGMKWEEICDKMHMSWMQVVNRLHSKALEELVIPKRKDDIE